MYIGVDIGGTDIKFGVVNSNGCILKKKKISTAKNTEKIIESIIEICDGFKEEYQISGIGVACPGYIIDGVVQNPGNLPFFKTPLCRLLSDATGLAVKVENDAQCAGLAEAKLGAGKDFSTMLMITLGTGVGGAIILDGKLFKGKNGGAGEVGHITLDHNGQSCPCGKKGCFEQYASVTALINQTKETALKHSESILAKLCSKEDSVNGKTVFEAMDMGCSVAQTVYEKYITYLAEGIDSAVMLLQPDIVLLGGAISSEGERLLVPLNKKLKTDTYVKIAKLGGDAGIIGAAMLCEL